MAETVPLSGILGEIAEHIGREAALALAQAYGGRTIYLPARMAPDHEIAQAIGYEAALSLVHAYGRGDFLVPMGPTGHYVASRMETAKRIAQLNEQGKGAGAIAREAGVHERTVYRHRAVGRPDPNQPGLFDD